MNRWEYLESSPGNNEKKTLNDFGVDGWELVVITIDIEDWTCWYFKRPLMPNHLGEIIVKRRSTKDTVTKSS